MHRVRFYLGTVKAEVLGFHGVPVTRPSTEGERRHARDGFGPALVTDQDWRGVESRLNEEWHGFTRYDAVGSWEGEQESTRVYEVLIPDVYLSDIRLNDMARELGRITGQAAVYYTRDEVRGGLVWSRIKGESTIEGGA